MKKTILLSLLISGLGFAQQRQQQGGAQKLGQQQQKKYNASKIKVLKHCDRFLSYENFQNENDSNHKLIRIREISCTDDLIQQCQQPSPSQQQQEPQDLGLRYEYLREHKNLHIGEASYFHGVLYSCEEQK